MKRRSFVFKLFVLLIGADFAQKKISGDGLMNEDGPIIWIYMFTSDQGWSAIEEYLKNRRNFEDIDGFNKINKNYEKLGYLLSHETQVSETKISQIYKFSNRAKAKEWEKDILNLKAQKGSLVHRERFQNELGMKIEFFERQES